MSQFQNLTQKQAVRHQTWWQWTGDGTGGPKVRDPSLLQPTGARSGSIYNLSSSNRRRFSIYLSYLIPAALPRTGFPSPGWGARLRPQESVAAAALPQLVTNSSAGASRSTRQSAEGRDQPCSLRSGKNLTATLVPLDWHSPNTACLFCWHIGLSLLPSHIFSPLGYNSHLHSTYYNILQQ